MLKQITLYFFILFSFNSFSQNESKTLSINENVGVCSDLKTLKSITITLKDFSETDTDIFIEKSKIYSHYITLTKVSSTKFKLEILGTSGWKYVGRFFKVAGVSLIKSNEKKILINDFITL